MYIQKKFQQHYLGFLFEIMFFYKLKYENVIQYHLNVSEWQAMFSSFQYFSSRLFWSSSLLIWFNKSSALFMMLSTY